MKRLALALATLVLGTTSAQAAMLASWENAAEGWAGVGSYSSTVGVTDGSYSAGVNVGGSGSWSSAFQQSGYSAANIVPLFGNDTISVDVTLSTPTPANSFQIAWQIMGGPGDTGDKGYQLVDYGSTTTVSFKYTDFFTPTQTPGWGQIRIIVNPINGFVAQTVYFDNLRVSPVPEPTSLGILGLAAMALLKRRSA